MNDASRSPSGRWRILAPAVLAWALVASAILVPGCGRWLAVAAFGIGVVAIGCVRARGRAVVLRCAGIACAMLVVLGARIDALEQVREDPQFARTATSGRATTLDIELRGFPKTSIDERGRRSSWAPAVARSASGDMPVVLWFAAGSLRSGSPRSGAEEPGDRSGDANLWGPGTLALASGTLVSLDAGSSARYGVRVTSFDAVATDGADSASATIRAVTTHAAARLRAGLREAAAAVPGAELVPGFAVGDTSLVPEHLDQQMRESSLTHLVAVSGANCALVVAAIFTVSGWLGVPRRARIALAGSALAGFVAVVGPDPSVQRAGVMAAVVLLSSFGGKRAIALPGLGLAVLALLVHDPWQALQPGFALSVAATAGILLWVPDVMLLLGRVFPSPQWVRLPVAVAIAAQFACGPLLLLVQSGFPAAGLVANVLAAPAAPWGTGLGLLALLAAPLLPEVSHACVWLASMPASWVVATAEVTAALPGARWAWPGGWGGAALLAGVEIAVLVAWWLLERRFGEHADRDPGAPSPGAPVTSGRTPWGWNVPRPRRTAVWIAALLCGALGAFLGPTLIAPTTARLTTPHTWSVVACDVGQGDALLLRDPGAPDTLMLVDTGDDPERLDSCLERFGVHRIAILVLTHDDRDHVGALSAIVDQVDRALIAPSNREDGDVRPVLASLQTAGVSTQVGGSGMIDALGGLHWEVLAPEPGATPADTNSASLVLRVEAGATSVLLLADTGEDEQLALQRTDADLDVDVVKVAHHGSSDHDPGIFTAASAEVALISVGADNGYGHPTASVIEGLRRTSTTVLRTDELGSIAVSGDPGALDVWAERGASSEEQSER